MITSEFVNERNILCIIFEQLLPAHIPSLQIPIRLNSLLRPLQCFFESDLREHVHEGTIPKGRRPIQVFQLDRITKERGKKIPTLEAGERALPLRRFRARSRSLKAADMAYSYITKTR